MVNAKTWNPAQIDQAIRRLEGIIRSGSYNPAELNQLLNQLGEPGYINTWNPAELDQKLRTLLHDLLTWKTATGNPIQLRTNNGGLVQSCEISFSPIQDLHGYDKPWAGGAGKNILPMVLSQIKADNTDGTWSGNTYTVNDVAFEVLVDSDNNVIGFKANGTASADAILRTSSQVTVTVRSVLNANFNQEGASSTTFEIGVRVYEGSTPATSHIRPDPLAVQANSLITYTQFVVRSGYQATNLQVQPQLEAGTTPTTFDPYSNICPISGWDSLHLYQDTEQTETPEKTYTATFTDTVYDGSYDFVSGKGQSKYGMVDLGDLTYNYVSENAYFYAVVDGIYVPTESSERNKGLISSQYKLADGTSANTMTNGEMLRASGRVYLKNTDYTDAEAFKTAMSGVQLCYELATAIEITLTEEEIELLAGENVLWTDGDSIEITYKKLLLPSDVETLSKKVEIEKPKTKRSRKKKEE